MKRMIPGLLILAGLLIGLVGWTLLPPYRGQLQYVVEVVDPRPWSEAEMPEGLDSVRVVRRLAFAPRPSTKLDTARIVRLTRASGSLGPAKIGMLPDMARHITSSNYELGSLPKSGPRWAAGASSGMERGEAQLGTRAVNVSILLGPLGPLFDDWLWTDFSQPLMLELADAGWQVQVSYVVFASSWQEQSQVLAELASDPGLLPAPSAEIRSPAKPPLLSHPIRLALALALICVGLWVLAVQLRGMSRHDLARRFRRG